MNDFNPVYFVTDPDSPTPKSPIREPRIAILVKHGNRAWMEARRPDGSPRFPGTIEILIPEKPDFDAALLGAVVRDQDHARSKHETHGSARAANELLQDLPFVRFQRDLSCAPHDLFPRRNGTKARWISSRNYCGDHQWARFCLRIQKRSFVDLALGSPAVLAIETGTESPVDGAF